MSAGRFAVVSSAWVTAPGSEPGVAVRSVAGALTRLAAVDIFVPEEPVPDAARARGSADNRGSADSTPRWPDGAFEVSTLPRIEAAAPRPARIGAVLVEAGAPDAMELARTHFSGVPLVAVGAATACSAIAESGSERDLAACIAVDLPASPSLPPGAGAGAGRGALHRTGLYLRIHPDARTRRHYGVRAVPPYLLVLGERAGTDRTRWPSARVRWLLARFPREHVAVIEGAVARVWRSRSCVARFEVHTRMDLWLLLAGARVVVDLLPGAVFAREPVEALRYGVPVVVPCGSPADGLVAAGGGLGFSSTAELLACVEEAVEPDRRATLAAAGKAVADHWYGDPGGLADRLREVLAGMRLGEELPLRPPTTGPAAGRRARSPSSPS